MAAAERSIVPTHRRRSSSASFVLPPVTLLKDHSSEDMTLEHAVSASLLTCRSQTAAVLASIALATSTFQPAKASALGVGNGLLDNCQPARVSCVSSQDDTPTSFLEPWEYDEALEAVKERLVSAVMLEPRTTVVVQQTRYIRFEIPTAIPDSIDDLEFFFPPLDNVVHFRSARRDRSFDFFLNRRRLDRLRQKIGLAPIPVLRNRMSTLSIFETPFDSFGPSAVDVDALIDNRGLGSRAVR